MREPLPNLQLRLHEHGQLLAWYAELVAMGSVALPEHLPPPPGERVMLELLTEDAAPLWLEASVLEGAPARVQVTPTLALRERVFLLATARRGPRLQSEAEGARRHPRVEAVLKVRFRSLSALFDEYVTNISEGGLFVRTDSPPPLHSPLELSVLFPDGTEKVVEGEVIRVVTPAEAALQKGAVAGVGVRFSDPCGSFTGATEHLLSTFLHRPRRVLVVDDDYFFLRVLSDSLMQAGFEVATAHGGHEAARKLVDLLYELDGVVLDLKMPGLDGYTLIERIRRLGIEMPLRIVLVSGMPDELLAPLVGAQGADAVVSKSCELPELLRRVTDALS